MTKRAIYPGTFDPVHYGHLDLMTRAMTLFDELIVGVYDHARPTKSSLVFSVEERMQMIEEALDGRSGVSIVRYSTLTVDFAKAMNANIIVRGLRVFSDFEFEFRMALANQRLMPGIETVSLMTREEHTFLSGTTVREIASLQGDVSSMVPPNVAQALYNRFNGEQADKYNRPLPLRD